MVNLVALTNEERATLKVLAADGPKRLRPPVLGRLALYKLITETPEGWRITEAGQDAVARAPARRTDKPTPPAPERSHWGLMARPRHQRRSPFD